MAHNEGAGQVRIDAFEYNGKAFLIIDIEETSTGPHQIDLPGTKHHGRFYVRRDRRNEPAVYDEIRAMFLRANRTPTLIHEFVTERRRGRPSDSGPMNDEFLRGLLLHISPRRGFGSRQLVDMLIDNKDYSIVGDQNGPALRPTPNALGASEEFDRGGLLPGIEQYYQVFYNGVCELYTQRPFRDHSASSSVNSRLVAIDVADFIYKDAASILNLHNAITSCNEFQVDFYVYGVSGHNLYIEDLTKIHNTEYKFDGWERGPQRFNTFSAPPMLVRLNGDASSVKNGLKPICDFVWRAWGLDSSPQDYANRY